MASIRPPIQVPDIGSASARAAANRIEGMRLVVGFDGRAGSSDALALAAAIAVPAGGDLVVASIRPYLPEALGAEGFSAAIAADERWIEHQAAQVLDDVPFSVAALPGADEPTALEDLAVAEGAGLIVLGSSHRGPLGRIWPGSVGERVLDHAPCAVAVAPRGLALREPSFAEIAVGYDGSSSSARALRLAIDLARRCGASILLVAVVEARRGAAEAGLTAEAGERARLRRHLQRATERVPAPLGVRSRLVRGVAGRALAEVAAGSDLLVLGSAGHYGTADRVALGSVASRVLRSAPCPTLIAPAR